MYTAAVTHDFGLMNDNVSPHRAVIFDVYLERELITRMEWIVYSLDLKPIENFWDAISCAICECFSHPSTLSDLKIAVQEEYSLLDSMVDDNLKEIMSTSYKPCTRGRGAHLSY